MKSKNTGKGGTVLPHSVNRLVIGICLLAFVFKSYGQVFENDSISVTDSIAAGEFAFVNYEADTISNGSYLSPFFNKLLRLEDCDSLQVNILHIGDSHIQADFITREVRKNMQLRFGNAGRGLVFPLRVTGTNEPADYRSASNVAWNVAKLSNASKSAGPGISGLSMNTVQNGAYFDITTYNHDDLDYAFNQVTLIHTKDSLQFDCRFTDNSLKFGYLMSALPLEPDEITTDVTFIHPTSYVRIQAEQTEAGQKTSTIHGLILRNGSPGVLYHSVGINGARFSDYSSSPLFFGQLNTVQPDLIIISLGTNEGANIKISGEEMTAAVSKMLSFIRSASPASLILITTPADDYFRKKYKNPYLETVHRSLLKVAETEKVACWDLYSITGGFGSCAEWRSAGMLQNDGIHYNKLGYTVQGSLLYKALIDSYFRYAAD